MAFACARAAFVGALTFEVLAVFVRAAEPPEAAAPPVATAEPLLLLVREAGRDGRVPVDIL